MDKPQPKQNVIPARHPAAAPAPARGPFPADADAHVLDRLNALYKYRLLMLTVFVLVLLRNHELGLFVERTAITLALAPVSLRLVIVKVEFALK